LRNAARDLMALRDGDRQRADNILFGASDLQKAKL
jgi:hypothetical protein